MIPIEKNNLKTIKLIDEMGNLIGYTYPKRAQGLLKNKRATKVSNNTICLLDCSYKRKEIMSSKKELNNLQNKGLNKIQIPKYSLCEELISSISHGVGALFSIAFLVICIVVSVKNHNVYGIISSSIYGAMSIILYTMSCLYHAFKVNKAKKVFRIFDHCSVYLLIAGTYTPYALVTLREASLLVGWTVFGVIWACAIIGIVFTSINMNKFKIPGLVLYLIMGWMIIFTFNILLNNLNVVGINLMLLGGVIYTIGAILYAIGKKVKYMHSIFHFFVLAASILFFFSIVLYVL